MIRSNDKRVDVFIKNTHLCVREISEIHIALHKLHQLHTLSVVNLRLWWTCTYYEPVTWRWMTKCCDGISVLHFNRSECSMPAINDVNGWRNSRLLIELGMKCITRRCVTVIVISYLNILRARSEIASMDERGNLESFKLRERSDDFLYQLVDDNCFDPQIK